MAAIEPRVTVMTRRGLRTLRWCRLVVEGRPTRHRIHLYPLMRYDTACGFSAEATASGLPFTLVAEEGPVGRCGRCERTAVNRISGRDWD